MQELTPSISKAHEQNDGMPDYAVQASVEATQVDPFDLHVDKYDWHYACVE